MTTQYIDRLVVAWDGIYSIVSFWNDNWKLEIKVIMPSFLRALVVGLLLNLQVLAATDFSTASGISTWNGTEWSLTATTFIPGQYQSRSSLANG